VTDAGPPRIHAVTFAAFNREPGCADTIANPRGWLTAAGKDSYFPHEAGEFTMTYDPSKMNCGRVQLDASFIDDNGKEHLIFGTVIDYGTVCVGPDPTPPPPTTTPTTPVPQVPTDPAPPGPPPVPTPRSVCDASAIILDYPFGSGRNIQTNAAGTDATIQFSIAQGCANVAVSLVSYQRTTEQFLPQKVVDGKTVVASSRAGGAGGGGGGGGGDGEKYTLTVKLPSCSMQADLYFGSYNPYEVLDWGNWASDYNPRTLDWIYNANCPQ